MIWRCCLGGFGCDVAACHSAFPSNATISPCASFTETPYSGKTIPASPKTSQNVLGGTLYAWEDGYQPGPNQAEPGLCEYDGGHI